MSLVLGPQVPLIYHRCIGDSVVTRFFDGILVCTHAMMHGVPADEGRQSLDAAFRQDFALSINAFVEHMSGRLVLLETGRKVFPSAELVVHEKTS